MIKIIFQRLYSVLLFMYFSSTGFSQTIINYQTWTGASGCNIFSQATAVPATINGTNNSVPHLTAIGQPTYDNVNKSVNIVSEIINGSQYQGTEYRSTVNFKLGYSYKITINAARIMSQQTGANVLLRLDLNSGGSGGNTLCNGTGVIDANGSGNLKQSLPITSPSFADYVFNYASLSAPQLYLMVGAVPPANAVLQTILIRKITIEETPPAISFNLTPTNVSLTCGSTTASTFTVNSSPGATGITNYTWNLGATPNGWLLPNGTAAPATYSTGLVNTLILTPDCGKAVKNVSATVTANLTAYNTNSSAVAITQPSMLIDGVASLCSGNTPYLITGLPCNATVAWVAPPASLATLSSLTGSPVNLTYAGSSGSFTLAANVTACGVTTALTKPVRVGGYTSSDYTISGNGMVYWCPNKSMSFYLSGPGSSNYNWVIPTGWTVNYNGGSYIVLNTPTSSYPPTGSLTVNFTEPCGTTLTKSVFLAYSSSACAGADTRYTYSPNPAPYYLNVAVASGSIGSVYIKKIQLVNGNTGATVYSQDYTYGNVTNTTITMTGYPTGAYTLRIYDGSAWSTYSIMH